MKTFFTRTMAAVVCLVAALTASAQYSKVFEQYPRTNYATDAVNWNLTEIATALSTDTATLVTALADINPDLFYLEGAENKAYNEGANGYYLDLDANKCDWGDVNSRWFVSPRWSLEDDTFGFVVGQHSNRMTGGEETGTAHFVLAMNGKTVTFDISLKIKEIDIPETPNLLSMLTIVGQKTTTVEQFLRSNSKADADTVDFKGVAATLGTTPEQLAAGLPQILFATKANKNAEDLDHYGFKTDTLTNASTANAPGWWFGESNDGYDELVSTASSEGRFFAESFVLNDETEELIFNIGQNGGRLPIIVEGMEPIYEVKSDVYFIWGTNAYRLTINLVTKEREQVPFSEMTEVGSEDIQLEQYPTSGYEALSFSLDLDAIAALLGVDASEIQLYAAESESSITNEISAQNQGFWFNKDGFRTTWGSNCGIFVENVTADDFSKFNVGQFPGAFEGGESGIATLYLVAGMNYYTVHVRMTILEKDTPVVEFTSVAERAVHIQVVPASDYAVEMRYTIDMDDVQTNIGTSSPILLARKAPAEGSEWTGEYDDRYSCEPHPGFWMSNDGYRSTWGTSGTNWGFSYLPDAAQFQFFQMPGQNQVGDEYKASAYLVNEENGKMITYNMTVRFVSTVVPEAEVVGQESIMIPVKPGKTSDIMLDVTSCLERLGLEEASLLFGGNTLVVLQEDGSFCSPLSVSDGAYLNGQGLLDTSDSNSEGRLYFNCEDNGEKGLTLYVDELSNAWEEDTKIMSRFGFQNENKLYIFNVSFVSEAVYVGISEATEIPLSVSRSLFHDLSGCHVKYPAQHGFYLIGGHKVVK